MVAKKKAAAKKRAQQQHQAAKAPNSTSGSEDVAMDAVNGHEDTSDAETAANASNAEIPQASPSTSLGAQFTFSMDLDGRTPSQRAEQRKAEGNVKFKEKMYGAASDLYGEAIELDPEEPSYYTNRAAASMALKRYRPALADCQKAAALQSANPQAKTLARLARCQIAIGQIDDAQRTLSEVLALDPKNAQALSDQAKVDKIRTDLTNVEREKAKKEWTYVIFGLDSLEKEVELPPLAWRVTRVEALLGKKRAEEASSLASDLMRINQNDPDVLWVRGLALFAQGNTAQAVAHAQAALRNDPDHTSAKALLRRARALDATKEAGNDLFKRSQWQDAIVKYTECLNMLEAGDESIRVTLLSNRATAHLKAGDNAAALEDADRILQSQPKHFKALRTRGRANMALENYDAAVADLAAAVQEAPGGSAEERAMRSEHRQAEVALKRSKTVDHYKILDVTRTATEIEIKKAYRKQSLIHHPDKGGSEEKFKEVSEAYAILSDTQKRRRYDLGEDDDDMMSSGFGGGGFHSHHPFASQGFGASPFGGGFQDGGINLEDFLGGGGGRSRRGFQSAGFGF